MTDLAEIEQILAEVREDGINASKLFSDPAGTVTLRNGNVVDNLRKRLEEIKTFKAIVNGTLDLPNTSGFLEGDFALVLTSGIFQVINSVWNKVAELPESLVSQLENIITTPDRPGDHYFLYANTSIGEVSDKISVDPSNIENNDLGNIYTQTGAGYVLLKNAVAISEDVWEVLARVRRETNPLDPSNHAVQLVAIWLDRNKQPFSETALDENLSLLISDNLVELSARVSAIPSAQNVVVPPNNAVYMAVGIRQYGDDGILSIETIRAKEVTDLHGLSEFDLSQVVADAESATTAANTAVATLDQTTLDSWGDVAATDLSSVGSISLRYGVTEFDGFGGTWVKDVGDTTSPNLPPMVLVDSSGARFKWTNHRVRDYNDVNNLTYQHVSEGAKVHWDDFVYVVAANTEPSPDLTTIGGVKLFMQEVSSGVDVRAFNTVADGVTNDGLSLQSAFDSSRKLSCGAKATSSIQNTLLTPLNTENYFDLSSLEITQPNGTNLTHFVELRGIGNTTGSFKFNFDGNRDNNTSIIGALITNTFAGYGGEVDVKGKNLYAVARLTGEVEHSKIKAHGIDSQFVVELDSTANTMDENDFYVEAYRVDTAFRTIGTNKTSGCVKVVGEVIDSWLVDLDNGWYDLSGIARGVAVSGGGGVRISGNTSRVLFNNLQVYGNTPAPNNSTVGLFCDTGAILQGDILLGVFDTGAWIKRCDRKSVLTVNLSSSAANGDGIILGDFANSFQQDGGIFYFSVNGASGAAVNLDNCKNAKIVMSGYVGGTSDIIISANSFDNTIEIGRGDATNRTIVNNRTQLDNTIYYRGNYTWTDVTNLNNGVHFNGMIVEQVVDATGFFSSAYYSSSRGGWIMHSQPSFESNATLSDATNHINTQFKTSGRMAYNQDDKLLYTALGSGVNDVWRPSATGVADITPV